MDRLISEPEVISMVCFSSMQIRRKEADGTFPKRIKLSEGRYGKVVWSLNEINEWIESRKDARND